MYRKTTQPEITPNEFKFSNQFKLSAKNRWVIMAELMPWEEFEEEYALNFPSETGAPAKQFRIALGSLIIKEKLGLTDRETVEQIRENPYLQYFIGLKQYQEEVELDASSLVNFRKRIPLELVNKINEEMIKKGKEKTEGNEENEEKEEEIAERSNQGKLILDASCAPADIRYPTDLGLLNDVRKETERIIDKQWSKKKGKLKKKPRTYRKASRKEYLKVARKRRVSVKERRRGIEKQLRYIERNLGIIKKLAEEEGGENLSKREQEKLIVIQKIYEQQREMWEERKNRVDERIVSLNQPHVRPIVRGKAGNPTEFGAKFSISYVDGYVFLDRVSWENFNESGDLKSQVNKYKKRYGYYPESVHVDQIYRTRENLKWCKERGIRVSGPPLGRPKKNVSEQEKKQAREDECYRNRIEGKLGQAKRRFSLNRIMTKLQSTSETSIGITILVVNLSQLLRQLLEVFLLFFIIKRTFQLKRESSINSVYHIGLLNQKKLSITEMNYL